MRSEDWTAVPGFEGQYEVSDHGRVRSLDRLDNRGRRFRGRILRTIIGVDRRPQVFLCRDGKPRPFRISRLVLEAFVGPAPPGHFACHFPDRDTTNNALENLRWGSVFDNHADMRFHGTQLHGERSPASKLTTIDLERIRDMRRAGCFQRDIAAWLGVGQAQISRILTGARRAHG